VNTNFDSITVLYYHSKVILTLNMNKIITLMGEGGQGSISGPCVKSEDLFCRNTQFWRKTPNFGKVSFLEKTITFANKFLDPGPQLVLICFEHII